MNGIAICWPDQSIRIRTIAKTRRIPLHCYPQQATIPGSRLALIAPNGEIQLLCVIEHISEKKTVRIAFGDFSSGYELIARRGTVRTNFRESLGQMTFRWRIIGQLRYFDQRSFRPIFITGERQQGPLLLNAEPEQGNACPRFREFTGSIAGIEHNDPEAKLVRRYTKVDRQSLPLSTIQACCGRRLDGLVQYHKMDPLRGQVSLRRSDRT